MTCFWCGDKGYVETAGDHAPGADCPFCKKDKEEKPPTKEEEKK